MRQKEKECWSFYTFVWLDSIIIVHSIYIYFEISFRLSVSGLDSFLFLFAGIFTLWTANLCGGVLHAHINVLQKKIVISQKGIHKYIQKYTILVFKHVCIYMCVQINMHSHTHKWNLHSLLGVLQTYYNIPI